MQTITATNLLLSTRCEFFYETQNAFVPMAKCAAKDLAETLDMVAGDVVAVEFHTVRDAKAQAADLKKFTKRLAGLAGWTITPWVNQVIRGHALDTTFVCELRRI